jgi:flagellar basal body-associated protein FliL
LSDKEKKEAASEAPPADAAPKKKSPVMMIAIVGAVMVIEAGAIFAVVGMTGGGASEATAQGIEEHGHDDSNEFVELPLVSDKFQNMQTGKTWIWNAEIVLRVKKKHEAAVSAAIQSKSAEILEGISMIFSRAQISQLKEPSRQTINRQITAFLNKAIGPDAEDHPQVDRVLFPKFVGFETD